MAPGLLQVAEKVAETVAADVIAAVKADGRYGPLVAGVAQQLLAELGHRAEPTPAEPPAPESMPMLEPAL